MIGLSFHHTNWKSWYNGHKNTQSTIVYHLMQTSNQTEIEIEIEMGTQLI